MNRREFLKTLGAAAGSAAFANTALASIPDQAGAEVIGHGWEAAGNGWYRVWKTFRGNMHGGFSLDFGEEGLKITPDSHAHLTQDEDEEVTFSCFIKGPDAHKAIQNVEFLNEAKGND
jgi:hypothetical protein